MLAAKAEPERGMKICVLARLPLSCSSTKLELMETFVFILLLNRWDASLQSFLHP